MGKKQIEKLVKLQYEVLKVQDNKERLRYIVAGIKDGRLYNMVGTNFGEFGEDVPDTEFITEDDLDLSRISSVRISAITLKMSNFFKKYGEVSNDSTNNDNTTFCNDTCNDASDKEDVTQKELKLNVDELIEKCKKAIKKGKFNKAAELITLLGDDKNAKKLSKKLKKAKK